MDILEFALIEFKHFRHPLEQLDRRHDQIIEVECLILPEASLVFRVHIGNDLIIIAPCILREFFRGDQFILR